MKRQNVRTLSLIVCTFLYLLVGAAVFDALESKKEATEKAELEETRNRIMDKYNITDDDMKILNKTLTKLVPHRAGVQWKFAGSFFFCMTVITTIGYGHSTPITTGGKIFCIVYALIGIPLNLVMFQSVGERLNIFMGFFVKKLKRILKFRKTEVSHTELVLLGFSFTGMITSAGALIFVKYENWSLIESVYFISITLTTVGFGDYVVLQHDNVLQMKPEYVAFSILYILIALVVVASVMNLLVLRLLTLNTEDERREQQEQELSLRQSALELNHIDHIGYTGHGPLLSGDKTEHQGVCTACVKNSHRTHDPYGMNCTGIHGNSIPMTNVYSTATYLDEDDYAEFRNSGQGRRKRLSI